MYTGPGDYSHWVGFNGESVDRAVKLTEATYASVRSAPVGGWVALRRAGRRRR